MLSVFADLHQAARRLASTPALSIGAVVTLAVGIGCTVVMADVLDRLLVRAPAQVADADRVARVYIGGRGGFMDLTGYETIDAMAGLRPDVESAAGYYEESLSFGRGATARQILVVAATPEYFAVLGVQPALGAWPAAQDAAVVSYSTWQREFGGTPDAIGKPFRLGQATYTVAAIAPRGFHGIGGLPADAWLPLAARAKAGYGDQWQNAHVFIHVIARLAPAVNRARADERATAAFRASNVSSFQSTKTVVLGDLRPARAPGAAMGTGVEVLIGAVSVIVLLITCGNVANILLVRGLRRGREFSVKTALGASRLRLLREVLLEAGLLSTAAGATALLVVVSAGSLVRDLLLPPVAALATPLDARVLLVTLALCLSAAFLLGIIPALRLTTRRATAPGHTSAGGPSPLIDAFCGVQVALALPMVVGAGLFVLSLWHARGQDFGMRTDRVVVVSTNLFDLGKPFGNQAAHRAMQERLARLPQVEATALAENAPMRHTVGMVVEGRRILVNHVDPSFFDVMGMRLTQGRLFTDAENRSRARPVAVVTESMARQTWPGQRAIGRCFDMGTPAAPCTEVVGVVADARLTPSIRPTPPSPACYFPIEQNSTTTNRVLLVRTAADPWRSLQMLRHEAQAAAPDLPYVDAYPFDELFLNLLKPWRLGSLVFVVFGVLATVIASVGLALVGAHAVTRRTKELGVRAALGAQPRQLVRLVLRRSLLLVLGGLGVGLVLAWGGGKAINALLFGVSAGDPRVMATSTAVIFAVGAIAAWVPARRAAEVEPVSALRAE